MQVSIRHFDQRLIYAFTRIRFLLGSYPWQGSSDYFLTSGDKIRFFFEKGVLDERGKLQPELAKGGDGDCFPALGMIPALQTMLNSGFVL